MLTITVLFILFCATAFQAQTLNKNSVIFFLYTSNHPEDPTTCRPGDLSDCDINVLSPIKILIHGYLGSASSEWVIATKNSYFEKGPHNIFTVDWSKITSKSYDKAVSDTSKVGDFIGKFIDELHTVKGVIYANIHIIGHSLGAHVGGFAGKYIILNDNEKISRITGLDPAGPGFVEKLPNETLNEADAYYTDIIHTDNYILGNPNYNLGRIHFYPNGGIRPQPGCISKRKRQIPITPSYISCSHTRSAIYFNESVNSYAFVATQCESYIHYLLGLCDGNPTTSMGDNVDHSLTGLFFLQTNSDFPYARG